MVQSTKEITIKEEQSGIEGGQKQQTKMVQCWQTIKYKWEEVGIVGQKLAK